jgi:hypothetical protein
VKIPNGDKIDSANSSYCRFSMADEPTIPQGPGFGLTFLYYFSGTALVTTFLAVKTLGIGLETGVPNQFGLLVGAVGGVLGAIFNRSMILELPFKSRKTFQRNLDETLAAMGYTEDKAADYDGILVYRRAALRQLFSGKIYVHLGAGQATISSRAMHVRSLKKRLP